MGEGSTTATPATVKTKRSGNNGNPSRSATPTTENNGVSKKRPRSETPSGNLASADADAAAAADADAAVSGGLNNSNNNENENGTKKKKTEGGTAAPGVSLSDPLPALTTTTTTSTSGLTFEEEIAFASSETTLRLLRTSLEKLTEGIPNRELKLIIAEAKACEATLEDELRILKSGLRLESQTTTPKKTTTAATTTTTSNPKGGVEKNPDDAALGNQSSADASNSAGDATKAVSYNTRLTPKETKALETMLQSEFTPPDTHWSLSALLGRLRHELTTPLPPFSQLPLHREKQGLTQLALNVGMTSQSTNKKRGPKAQQVATAPSANANAKTNAKTNTTSHDSNDKALGESVPASGATKEAKTEEEASSTASASNSASAPLAPSSQLSETSQFKRLEFLADYTEYKREHSTPDKLLTVWKKLSTHRSSLVFRRPVNPKEAPGYTDRIRFPMDLSLIRKLILSKHIKNYEGILKQVHLIGHNCVKYNGRESDYALVTREFESVATEYVWNAVMKDTYGGNRGRWSRNASPIVTPTTTGGSSTTPFPATTAAATTAAADSSAHDSKIKNKTNEKALLVEATSEKTKAAATATTTTTTEPSKS